MTVPCVVGLFLAWTLIPSNVAGRTKRTLTSSFTFVGYCVGNMVGSQIFKAKDAVCSFSLLFLLIPLLLSHLLSTSFPLPPFYFLFPCVQISALNKNVTY